MHRIARRSFLAALALPAVPGAAFAQSGFPNRPIHIVVPFPPGGSTDLLARRIGEKMQAAWKQPVVVDNRPGAGGTLGAGMVAKSPADGYTLLMGVTGSNAIGPALYSNLTYDPIRDFAPVSMASVSPLILVVGPKVQAKTLEQFIALAKAKPKGITHGTPGNGTSMHLTAEMFQIATGTQLVHVPYKGSAQVLQDLLGGQIDCMFSDAQVLMPTIKAGKVTALVVSSSKRHPLLPDVPTMAEKGYTGFEALSWQGVFAPAGTPPAIVSQLSEEIDKALNSADMQAFFSPTGLIVEGSTPAVFRAFVENEVHKWANIVHKAGVKVE
jgi:tripartite-type tricarboxylate transporter receptor subunit TctC